MARTQAAEANYGKPAGAAVKIGGGIARHQLGKGMDHCCGEAAELVKAKAGELMRHFGWLKPEAAKAVQQNVRGSLAPAVQLPPPAAAAGGGGAGMVGQGVGGAAGLAGNLVGALPFVQLGVSVVSLGLAAYNTHQLGKALRKLDGMDGKLDGLVAGLAGLDFKLDDLAEAVRHNGMVLCNLVVACEAGFDNLAAQLQTLLDRVNGVAQVLNDMEQDALVLAVKKLQLLHQRWLEELNGASTYRDSGCRRDLLSHARDVQVLVTHRLGKKQPGDPTRLGLVMLWAWAVRIEIDTEVWEEAYHRDVCRLLEKLHQQEESCERLVRKWLCMADKYLVCLDAPDSHDASRNREEEEEAGQHDGTANRLLERDGLGNGVVSTAAEAHEAIHAAARTRAELATLKRQVELSERFRSRLVEAASQVATEARNLCQSCTLYELACTHRSVLQQYVFLHRGLLLGLGGASAQIDSVDIMPWNDDNLVMVRNLGVSHRKLGTAITPVKHYPLRTLGQMVFYADLTGTNYDEFVPGEDDCRITTAEIGARLGLPSDVSEALASTGATLSRLEKAALKAPALRRQLMERLASALCRAPAALDDGSTAATIPALPTPEQVAVKHAEQEAGVKLGVEKAALPVHHGITCDECRVVPIRGQRYMSLSRHNFHLCSKCYLARDGKDWSTDNFVSLHNPPSEGMLPAVQVAVKHAEQEALMQRLHSATPDNRRVILGGTLYPLIKKIEPVAAAKVTGMLLEMDQQSKVLHLIDSPESLQAKVQEAITVLKEAGQDPHAVLGQHA